MSLGVKKAGCVLQYWFINRPRGMPVAKVPCTKMKNT